MSFTDSLRECSIYDSTRLCLPLVLSSDLQHLNKIFRITGGETGGQTGGLAGGRTVSQSSTKMATQNGVLNASLFIRMCPWRRSRLALSASDLGLLLSYLGISISICMCISICICARIYDSVCSLLHIS